MVSVGPIDFRWCQQRKPAPRIDNGLADRGDVLGEGACFGRAHPRVARGLGPPGETCLHPSSSA